MNQFFRCVFPCEVRLQLRRKSFSKKRRFIDNRMKLWVGLVFLFVSSQMGTYARPIPVPFYEGAHFSISPTCYFLKVASRLNCLTDFFFFSFYAQLCVSIKVGMIINLALGRVNWVMIARPHLPMTK